ncbi:MAG: hypothetical protein ACJA0P_002833 [Planctomycetota bacterium]|jgi:hypothetical protein
MVHGNRGKGASTLRSLAAHGVAGGCRGARVPCAAGISGRFTMSQHPNLPPGFKVIGIGLNKTGTKTMAHHLRAWGLRHRTYDSQSTTESPSFRLYEAGEIDALMDIVDAHDSCEDWPWPLLYREIDARFPEAKFVLTTRTSADVWYRSLCNMAVRIGPLPLYEQSVYGSSMPQGRRDEHVRIYEEHNRAVEDHFAGRPDKLIKLSWGEGGEAEKLAEFLGFEGVPTEPLHVNRSPTKVYSGDSLPMAHVHRLIYQKLRAPGSLGERVGAAIRVKLLRRK